MLLQSQTNHHWNTTTKLRVILMLHFGVRCFVLHWMERSIVAMWLHPGYSLYMKYTLCYNYAIINAHLIYRESGTSLLWPLNKTPLKQSFHSADAFIQTFTVYTLYTWVLWSGSAVMRTDICDKCSDHKLSHHSSTRLPASPGVALGTLSLLSCSCMAPPSALRAADVLDTLGQGSLW